MLLYFIFSCSKFTNLMKSTLKKSNADFIKLNPHMKLLRSDEETENINKTLSGGEEISKKTSQKNKIK